MAFPLFGNIVRHTQKKVVTELDTECSGSVHWLCAVRSGRGNSSASLCQTEVQKCLVWLSSLFDQAVSGILTDLLSSQMRPSLQKPFSVSPPFQQSLLFTDMIFSALHSFMSFLKTHRCIRPVAPYIRMWNLPFFFFALFKWNECSIWPCSPLSCLFFWSQPQSKVYWHTSCQECNCDWLVCHGFKKVSWQWAAYYCRPPVKLPIRQANGSFKGPGIFFLLQMCQTVDRLPAEPVSIHKKKSFQVSHYQIINLIPETWCELPFFPGSDSSNKWINNSIEVVVPLTMPNLLDLIFAHHNE